MKQSSKKNIFSFQVMRTSHYKEKQRRFNQKGMSFIELTVAAGITVLLSSAGYVTYSYYSKVAGTLTALQQKGTRVLEQVQVCTEESVMNTGSENLLPVDGNGDGDTTDPEDWGGCNAKNKLALNDCEWCDEPLVVDGRFCMTIENDKFSSCVGYRPTAGTITRFKFTVNYKVCTAARGLTSNACTADSDCASGEKCVTISGVKRCEDSDDRSAVWPFVPCDDDTECETGLHCLESQGKCRQISSTVVKCV